MLDLRFWPGPPLRGPIQLYGAKGRARLQPHQLRRTQHRRRGVLPLRQRRPLSVQEDRTTG